jgi:hypothetical protein
MLPTQTSSAIDRLLNDACFARELERILIKPQVSSSLLKTFAKFISRQPETFTSPSTFKAFHQMLRAGENQAEALCCLSKMLSCCAGLQLADDSDFLSTLVTVILSAEISAPVAVVATEALTNIMLHPKAFQSSSTPWSKLVSVLIHQCYTKENRSLQEISIQALRVMSDKASVKDELRQVYKEKIANVPCLGESSSKLLKDLVQWLSYRNYKSCEGGKYSKLFI